jgi:hypothetical protein
MSKWYDYFTQGTFDYPKPTSMPLVPSRCEACDYRPIGGIRFAYISTTFLNGWINYVTIDRAYLITRYRKHAENVARLDEFHKENAFHSDLNLGDDVVILARGEDGAWWEFWYDQDCSDACIGRFTTTDDADTVRARFDEFVRDLDDGANEGGDSGPPLPIDVTKIRGWVKG